MAPSKNRLTAFVAAWSVVLAAATTAQVPRLERFRIGRFDVAVLAVEGAPRQIALSVLPTSLLGDAKGEPQVSHLLEHLMIRSTDAYGLGDPTLQVNGETSALALRLESIAVPPRWEEALRKHLTWVETTTAPLDVLSREKKNIGREESSTCANGFSHKWAQAAWAQAALHGVAEIPVHGAVAAMSPETSGTRLEALRKRRVYLFTAGPASRDAVAEALEKALDAKVAAAPSPASIPTATTAPNFVAPPPDQVTWDLATRHLIRWVSFPSTEAATRASLVITADALTGALSASPSLRKLGLKAFGSGGHVVAGRTLLMVNAFVPEGVAEKEAERALDAVLSSRQPLRAMAWQLRRTYRARVASLPDFAAARARAPARARHLADAQAALDVLQLELRTGAPFESLAETYEAVALPKVMEAAAALTGPEARTLWITPSR